MSPRGLPSNSPGALGGMMGRQRRGEVGEERLKNAENELGRGGVGRIVPDTSPGVFHF